MRTVGILLVALSMLAGSAPAGEKPVLRTEAIVPGPVSEVWAAFTTKEGLESWLVPVAEVDFRIGGAWRTNYNPKAKIGDAGTITHHILSYEPERMMSSRFTAPENAPVAKVAEATWMVIRFEPVGAAKTRVSVAMMGWGEGPDWEKARKHFERGNEYTLKKLVERFENPRASVAAPAVSGSSDLMAGKVRTGRSISLKKAVACDASAAYRLWTTEEGVKKFFAPAVNLDLQPGGRYEVLMAPDIDPKGESFGTGGARVLKVVPDREFWFEWISFVIEDGRTSPGPPRLPAAERNERPIPTWIELAFEPVLQEGARTLVRLEHHGFRTGEKWDGSLAYFTKAWATVLDRMAKACGE